MPTTEEKSKVIKEHATSKDDVGSTPVQIALLTARITELTAHLKRNPKDNHSERGLELLVGKRRRLLNYLARIDEPAYQDILKKLKLRK